MRVDPSDWQDAKLPPTEQEKRIAELESAIIELRNDLEEWKDGSRPLNSQRIAELEKENKRLRLAMNESWDSEKLLIDIGRAVVEYETAPSKGSMIADLGDWLKITEMVTAYLEQKDD